MKIIRLENGTVEFRTDSDQFILSIPALPTEIKPIPNIPHVKIYQGDSRVEYVKPSEVISTQVLPNAEVPFVGDVYNLASLLSSDFFYC